MRAVVLILAGTSAVAAHVLPEAPSAVHLSSLRAASAAGDEAEAEVFTWHGLQLGKHIPEYNDNAEKVFGTPKDAFEAADLNGDGRLGPAEWHKHWKKLECSAFHGWMAFKEADVSEDGFLTAKEYYTAVGDEGGSWKFAHSPKKGSKEVIQDEENY